ncbi:MAG: site-specific integrase [Balneolaceae bacterium]|nr:site-specific integrase [Balneolaceae bacterium]
MEYKLYPFKREGKYRYYVRFNDEQGQRKNLSTGVTYPLKYTNKQKAQALKQAKKVAKQRVLEYFGMADKKESFKVHRLSDYLEHHYYPHVRTNCAESTLVSYRNALTHFLRICGDKPLKAYKLSDLQYYKVHRFEKEQIKKTTINIELRSVKAAFNWAYKNEYVDKFSFRGQEYMFKTKPNRREFKMYELQRLLKQTEGKMIGQVIRLAYYTGMRIGELSDIQWQMINFEKRFIDLPLQITKGNKPRKIPICRNAYYIIKFFKHVLEKKRENHPKWYKHKPFERCYVVQKKRGIGQYQPRSIQDMFRKEMNKAGLPKELKFHCLRHSFATHTLENGADINGVKKIMGHSTLGVIEQFYDHTTALDHRDVVELI